MSSGHKFAFFFLLKTRSSITGYGLGVVVRSESADAKVGDHVYGLLGGWNRTSDDLKPDAHPAEYQQYITRPSLAAEDGLRIVENKENLPWSLYVGVLGMPGRKI